MDKKEFHMAFEISRTTIFEVSYYTLSSNPKPYFTTSAEVFNRPKTDYNQCGQCQKEVLKGIAYKFWNKWDKKHLDDLTDNEYNELMEDLNELKEHYNYIEKFGDKGFSNGFSFYDIKELSMRKIKK